MGIPEEMRPGGWGEEAAAGVKKQQACAGGMGGDG